MVLINSNQVMLAGERDTLEKELVVAVAKFLAKVQSQTGGKFGGLVETFADKVKHIDKHTTDEDIHEQLFGSKSTKKKKKKKNKIKKEKGE